MDLSVKKPRSKANNLVITIAIAVVVTLVISGTFAWFTYRANDAIHFEVGHVSLSTTFNYVPSSGPYVCNEPIITEISFSKPNTSVACYVRVYFSYVDQGNLNSEDLAILNLINQTPVKPYTSGATYTWVRRGNFYYMVTKASLTTMLRVEEEDTARYNFCLNGVFPDVDVINNTLLSQIKFVCHIQAIQANYLMDASNDYITEQNNIVGIETLMNSSFPSIA